MCRLECDAQEENTKPFGRCRGRAKRPEALEHGIPVRQPGQTATGMPLSIKPAMKMAILKYIKADGGEEKGRGLEPTEVRGTRTLVTNTFSLCTQHLSCI